MSLSLTRKTLQFEVNDNGLLEYNYNYPLMKIIYQVMTKTNNKYALQVHDEGFNSDNKKFKLFNYTLQFEKGTEYLKTGISLNKGNYIKLILSGETKVLNNIIKGFISNNKFELNNIEFQLVNIDDIKIGRFKKVMLYKVRTPIVESVYNEGKIHYLSPDTEQFYQTLAQNLFRKYKIIYGKEYEGELYFDIEDMLKVKKKFISKIKNNGYVIGYTDFEIFIEADEGMQKVAYYLGLGQNNSLGMGNISIILGRD